VPARGHQRLRVITQQEANQLPWRARDMRMNEVAPTNQVDFFDGEVGDPVVLFV